MEIKAKVFKRKAGKSKGKWIARIDYFDRKENKWRCWERIAASKTKAGEMRDGRIDELKRTDGEIRTGDAMTFADLAAHSLLKFYQPAEIVEGRTIAGVRAPNTPRVQLKNLEAFFGSWDLRDITTESLTDYKRWRIKQGTLNPTIKKARPVKLTTVNRELSTMRRVMKYAFAKGWILKDIFLGSEVIDGDAEVERTRLLTPAEEGRLLAACHGERLVPYTRRKRGQPQETEEIVAVHKVDNPFLKAMIVLALDSGMRRGEIQKMRWADLDFENGLIRILGTHTKTQRERLAPLSLRAKKELENLRPFTGAKENPFPKQDIKRSWSTAKKLAGIDDLHFHDLRRSAIVRWIQQGVPMAFAGKLAGHSQPATTQKHYVATDADIVRGITEKMNLFHSQNAEINIDNKTSEFVN